MTSNMHKDHQLVETVALVILILFVHYHLHASLIFSGTIHSDMVNATQSEMITHIDMGDDHIDIPYPISIIHIP